MSIVESYYLVRDDLSAIVGIWSISDDGCDKTEWTGETWEVQIVQGADGQLVMDNSWMVAETGRTKLGFFRGNGFQIDGDNVSATVDYAKYEPFGAAVEGTLTVNLVREQICY